MIRLAVMRPKDKMDESIQMAKELGFDPVPASPLQIVTNESGEFNQFIDELERGKVDMAVLTSSTGVSSLMQLVDRRMEREELLRYLKDVTMIAIGPLTAQAMEREGMVVSLIPEVFSSEGLTDTLSRMEVAGKRVFVLRSNHGERSLMEGLIEAGTEVTEVVVYRLVPQPDTPEMKALIDETRAGRVDAFAFTSSLSAETFIKAAETVVSRERIVEAVNGRVVAAMGAPTKERLEKMGIRVDVVASRAVFRDMLLAIRSYMTG
jgi:uroporphyrinogen-III synthase